MNSSSQFAIYYAGDAYTTSNKIMGRQSAGKAFMKGIARTYPSGELRGLGALNRSANEMVSQLKSNGFSGQLKWGVVPDWRVAAEVGTLYYPAPPAKEIAAARNLSNPVSFSLMGVTHTLSSTGAMDQISDLVLPPFCSWDALICTSQAAKTLVVQLQEEMQDYWCNSLGATKFVNVQLPVIPLGVDVPAFLQPLNAKTEAREVMNLSPSEVAFLFAGRLSFHAKANPAPVYQALEKIAKEIPIVCIEAGVFPSDGIKQGYDAAQKALAPSVRFIWVDGNKELQYQQAWQAADIFVSLSDNIQETFGLTPVEAMAAGLPVVVSDWNGYKDTIRDGIDGFRVPTILPPSSIGADLALRSALGLDTYDFYIGRTSLATVVDPIILTQVFKQLATSSGLRAQMGAAGQQRAKQQYDWPHIIHRYSKLASELNSLRQQQTGIQHLKSWPQRADPFHRFAHFSTSTLSGHWLVQASADAEIRLKSLLSLSMTNYAMDAELLRTESLQALLHDVIANDKQSVNQLLAQTQLATPMGVRALLWLWKFDVVQVIQIP
jgi:starch synthase